jgi:hypothetical protein
MHGIIMENTTCPVSPAATINMFYSHGSGRCDDAVLLRSSLPGVGLVTLVVVRRRNVVVNYRMARYKYYLSQGCIRIFVYDYPG